MISLEGLTLVTGRHDEARGILRTFAHHVRDGLIPNLFPEGENEGLYHTADATLWFFHALDRYEQHDRRRRDAPAAAADAGRDRRARTSRGTRFGIGVDPADGLLRQGAHGYQLTWMDAKVDDWVVTPRRGKAVEINALCATTRCGCWSAGCARRGAADAAAASTCAAGRRRARSADALYASFNARFWYAGGGYLYDVVDGEARRRRRQLPAQPDAGDLAAAPGARPAPLAAGAATSSRERLLTPFGLRSLAPGHPDYKPRYDGDLRARDAAYHQGTVWGWLIGPFVDAWLQDLPRAIAPARAACSTASNRSWARRASARSARSSTPSRRSRRAAASPRRGASPRRCARFA